MSDDEIKFALARLAEVDRMMEPDSHGNRPEFVRIWWDGERFQFEPVWADQAKVPA